MARKTWTDRFDEEAADRAVRFFSRYLRHTKGRWAGGAFALERWQRDIVREVFGQKREDGTRRYRRAYIEVPRKNGKSTLCAGVALLLLFADNEPGAEIYSAAADRKQAAIVFETAKAMVEASPKLRERAKVYRHSIYVPKTGCRYEVLSADAYTKHGLNAHGIIFDELHAQPNRELWDVLTTSVGARVQPLIMAITTAGYDRQSVCYEQHDYAERVAKGVVDDPSFFAFIAAADADADWRKPSVWKQANPSLGVTITKDYLRQEAKRAEQVPAYQNTFRRLHLNQWTQQEDRLIDMAAWDASSGTVDSEALRGQLCYGGLDLANTTDVAAFVLNFPPKEEGAPHDILPFFWIPEDNMRDRSLRDRVPYDAWVRDGLMKATPGNVIDHSTILKDIEALGEKYNISEIAYDRWGATQISIQLQDAGFTIAQMGQGFKDMSPPTKELVRLTLAKLLRHGGHPVLRWMCDNLEARTDPAGNLKPDKAKSREKIDGMVALIMALDRSLRHESTRSVYEDRGIVTIG